MQIIQTRREIDEGFTRPKLENGEVFTEQMNVSLTELYSIHSATSGGHTNGHSPKEVSNPSPDGAKEQYLAEHHDGRRLFGGMSAHSDVDELQIVLRVEFSSLASPHPMVMTINLWIPGTGFLNDPMTLDIPSSTMHGSALGGRDVVFQGLSRLELQDAYFIFRLYRYEAFSQASGESRMVVGSRDDMKRPYACGLMSLKNEEFHQRPVNAQSLTLVDPFPWYACVTSADNERFFGTLHELIISGAESYYTTLSRQLLFTMVLMMSLSLQQENIVGKAISRRIVQSNFYPVPSVTINDFFITLECGNFSQDSKKTARNVEVVCYVIDSTGEPRKCIQLCKSNSAPTHEYRSAVFYHNNKPVYSEIFKIDVSELGDDFYSSHVLFMFHHWSSSSGKEERSLFAFGVLMLADIETSTVISDSTSVLQCFEILDEMRDKDVHELHAIYFDENVSLVPRMLRNTLGLSQVNETITISTKLVSTTITQDLHIHRLLTITLDEETDHDELVSVFEGCTYAPPPLLVSYVSSILNKVFCAITNLPHVAEPAFRLATFIIDLFHKSPFSRYMNHLDKYVENVFDNHDMFSCLISHADSAFIWMDYSTITPNKLHCEATVRCISKFIELSSASKHLRATCGIDKISKDIVDDSSLSESIHQPLLSLLKRFIKLMNFASSLPWIKILKKTVVQNFASILRGSFVYFSFSELSLLVRDFLFAYSISDIAAEEVSEDHSSGHRIRLELLQGLVLTDLFIHNESRAEIFDGITTLLLPHLSTKEMEIETVQSILDQIVKCLTVLGHTETDKRNSLLIANACLAFLADQLLQVYSVTPNPYKDIATLLDPSPTAFVITKKFDHIKPTISIVFGLFEYLRFDSVIEIICDEDAPEKMIQLLTVLCVILQQLHVIYPYSWIAMKMQILKSGIVYNIFLFIRSFHILYKILTHYVLNFALALRCFHILQFAFCNEKIFSNIDSKQSPEYSVVLGLFSTRDLLVSSRLYTKLMYFELIVYFLANPVLNIEDDADVQSVTRVDFISTNFDDLRIAARELLPSTWEKLLREVISLNDVSTKQNALTNLVSPIILLIGSYNSDTKDIGVHMLLSLLALSLELDEPGSLASCRNALFVHLISIMHVSEDHKDSKTFVSFDFERFDRFISEDLLACIQNDPALRGTEAVHLAHDIAFLFRLQDSLEYYTEADNCLEEIADIAHQAMIFSLGQGLLEYHHRIVHSLVLEYLTQKKMLEASYLLMAHADMLPWDELLHVPAMTFGFRESTTIGKMTAWTLKVLLTETAIDLADKELDWERCILLLDHLIQALRLKFINHESIRIYLNRQLAYYDKIASEFRLHWSFFLVCFICGSKNEEFIYRGKRSETMAEFSGTLKSKYPNAIFLKKTFTLSEADLASEKLYIIVTKVQPYFSESVHNHLSTGTSIPSNAFSYIVQTRQDSSVVNEFLDLWGTSYILNTRNSLPGTCCKVEVISSSSSILNPIEMATNALKDRSKILERAVETMKKVGENSAPQQVTMEISGTVDAAVNGGLKNYICILSGEYKVINPAIEKDIMDSKEKSLTVQRFRSAFLGQMDALKAAVELHKVCVHEQMRPLHEHLEKCFNLLSSEVKQYFIERS